MDVWELRSHHRWKESSDCLSLKLQNCLHIGAAALPVIYWQNCWNGGFKTEKQAWTTARWRFLPFNYTGEEMFAGLLPNQSKERKFL